MLWLDLIILGVIVAFVVYGMRVGFVRSLVSLFAITLSLLLAANYYQPITFRLTAKTGWDVNFLGILVFIIIMLVVSRLINFAFWILRRFFSFLRWIPFTVSINRILGMLLGLTEGVLITGITLLFLTAHPLNDRISEYVSESFLVPYLLSLTEFLLRIIPGGFNGFGNAVQYIV